MTISVGVKLEAEAYEDRKAEDMARWQRYLDTGYAISDDVAQEWLDKLAAGEDAACPT